jgi:cysteinyl-tRNA synthetase
MGVSIFNIDYAAERSHVDDAYQSNGRQGIIPFVANSRLLDTLPGYPAPVYRNNDHDMISLKDAENFLCLINPQNYSSKDQYLTALRNTDYDVLIIDFCFDGQPLTAADIAKIKVKKNGGKRLVLAYMSIGEAEDYRFYWQSSWSKERPGWIAEENAEWPGNYLVKYWDTAWQEIIFGHSYSYLDRVMAAGFSGVFLDLLDAYQYFEE